MHFRGFYLQMLCMSATWISSVLRKHFCQAQQGTIHEDVWLNE